ncbi:prion-like-(Q/N-rich) domain-bearing protein 25 [Littorina saxatilis]|uniref:prion-like-(Q/N-rich) domain-bearing protein 25 n=1 Tax=Littorina saxatilis TaxID=31220 RepID=UPI0038B615B4
MNAIVLWLTPPASGINAGQPCNSTNPDPMQCVAKATCTGETCECDATYYNNAGTCASRLTVGQPCDVNVQDQCAANLECENRDSDTKCRIPAGSATSCTNTDANCVTGSVCENNLCKVSQGGICTTGQCVDGATCSGTSGTSGTCDCNNDRYPDGTVCLTRLTVGQPCDVNVQDQCAANLECENRDSDTKCRIPAGSTTTCGSSDTNCVSGSICENNLCKVSQGGICTTGQCVDGATCSGTSGTSGTCDCNNDRYPDGTVCLTRLMVGQPCDITVQRQCANNLQCNTRDSDTKCRIPSGSATTCTNTDANCVSGSVCDNDVCIVAKKESV